jgi:alpha 1,2-mannosyltransferase
MRFDEDSFLHSPIDYDIFDLMKQNDYNYGFRLCAYEMGVVRRIWALWRNAGGSPDPYRDIEFEMCGTYNNFFVAKIDFFLSGPVQRFLKFVNRQGTIYPRRLGDLMIHSMAVYAFSPSKKIHRFLDFTYEHAIVDKTGCVVWGGIQAGYNDPKADKTLQQYMHEKVIGKGCTANVTMSTKENLSPMYQHLPDSMNGKL